MGFLKFARQVKLRAQQDAPYFQKLNNSALEVQRFDN